MSATTIPGSSRRISRRALLTGAAGLSAAVAGALAGCDAPPSGTGHGPTAWFHEYGEQGANEALRRYAGDFPGGPANVRIVPGDFDSVLAAALDAGSGPDVFEHANGPTLDMIKAGAVLDVTDLLGDARADFNPALLERMTYRGKLYGVPQTTDAQLLVYRKSLLAAAGVPAPRTLEDLLSAASELTTDDRPGLFLGNDGGVSVLGGPLLWSTGREHLVDGRCAVAHRDLARALRLLHDSYASGDLLLGAPRDWADPEALIAGRCAMQWTGLWALPRIKDAFGEDVGVCPFPAAGPDGAPSVPFGAFASAISARTTDLARARRFVSWLWVTRTDLQAEFSSQYGLHLPARKSLLAATEALSSGLYGEAAALVTSVGHPQSPLRWTPRCEASYRAALDSSIRSGADPMPELQAVATVVGAELRRT